MGDVVNLDKVDIIFTSADSGYEVGRISNPLEIEKFISEFEKLGFSEKTERLDYEGGRFSMTLTLMDGTTVVYAVNGKLATGFGNVELTEDLMVAIKGSILYFGDGVPSGNLGHGLSSPEDFMDEQYDSGVLWNAYIDNLEGDALYLSRNGSVKDDKRWLLDPGSVSCVGRSGNYLYYLNEAGQMMRLHNKFVYYEAALFQNLTDDNIWSYFEKELYDEKPYANFRIVNGVFYTVDTSGTPCQDGTAIAKK